MYVFHYDRETSAYLGGEPCEFDRLEPGRPVVPAWASATPPPPATQWMDGKHWCFFDAARGAWVVRDVVLQ